MAHGDAQIDFHYRLAHGVEHGLERIETFLKNLDIIDSVIYFDTDKVTEDLKLELGAHRNQLTYYYDKYKQRAEDALNVAKKHYNEVIAITTDFTEKEGMQKTLKIIEARLSFRYVIEMFELCNFEDLTLADLPILDVINIKLSDACNDLPEQKGSLKSKLSQMSLNLVNIYTNLGNNIFQLKNFKDAIEPYQKALKLYQTLLGDQAYYSEKLNIISNLILAYKNLGEVKESILLVKDVLMECPTNDHLLTLKRDEIFCNFVDCVAIELQKLQVLGLREKLEYLAKELVSIIYECSEYISETEIVKLKDQLSMFENRYQIPEKEVFSFGQHFTFSNLVSPQFFPFSSIKTVDTKVSIQSEESIKNEVIRK